MDTVLRYLRQNPKIIFNQVLMTGAAQKVFGGDPDRYLIVHPAAAGTQLYGGFGEAVPANFQFMTQSNSGTLFLIEDLVGPLVQLPYWAWEGTGGTSIQFIAVSYNPADKREMNAYVKRILSNAGAL